MRFHFFIVVVAAAVVSPAAGNVLGFDFKTTPCRFTPATALPDFNRPCDIPPRNATTGDFYNFQISADETEACCPWVSGTNWYWIRVDKTNFLGATRPDTPAPGPVGEAADDLPSSVPVAASDPYNEDNKPPSAAGARSLVLTAAVAVGAVAVLL